MERVEDEVVALVGPSMPSDDLRTTADYDFVDVSPDQHLPMTVGHRNRVVVGTVPDQR